MYTLYGDSDLSGTVDFSDLNTVLSYYNKPGTWAVGDFNYDGQVDFADLNSVLSFYNQSVPVVVDASSYNDLDGGAIDALSGAGISVVPEPSSVVLLASCSPRFGLRVAETKATWFRFPCNYS